MRRRSDGLCEEDAGLLAAAATNLLFAEEPDAMHDHIPEDVVEQVAAWFVRHADDDDLPFAVVMSLRTLMTLHTDARGSEAMMRIMQRVQWIEGLVPFPAEAPTPGMMTDLAKTLQGRYLPRRMTG